MEPFVPLSAPVLTGNEEKYLVEAIRSGWLTHRGDFHDRFEKLLSAYLGKPAMLTSSGTMALYTALCTLGIGPGDEVLVPALTFGATASVVVRLGADPVLVDVDPETWGMNMRLARKAMTRRTKAAIPVHLYGMRCDFEAIRNLPIVEDSCEAFGLVEPTGTYTCYSFFGNKMIACGEGGAIVGRDLKWARRAADGGFGDNYFHEIAGLNCRMTNLQAAVGCAQMDRFPELILRRVRNCAIYRERLSGRGRWLFVVDTKNPEGLSSYLSIFGIQSRRVFPPLNLQSAFGVHKGDFPASMHAWQNGLCLPTGPGLTDEQINFVCDKVEEYGYHDLRGTANRPR